MSEKNKKTIRKPKTDNIMRSFLPDDLRAPMEFETAELIEVPVKIEGKDYVLREADEAAAVAYTDARMAATKFESDANDKIRVTGMDGLAKVRPLLVSKCLFKVCEDDPDSMEPVPYEAVLRMKPHIVKELFERAKLISNLEEKETPEEINKKIADLERKRSSLSDDKGDRSKNSPDATTPTSV